MGLGATAIQRSLEKLAFSIRVKAVAKANAGNAYQLTEVFQQYQIDVSGSVGSSPAFNEVQVPFQEMFYDVPGQRDSNHSEPHFTCGLVLDDGSPDLIYSVAVTDWNTDAQGNFTAATVRIGMFNPVLGSGTSFTGRLHVTFQGYSAPTDTTPADDGAMQ